MTRRQVLMCSLMAVAVALGAVRDFLTVNLNYQIDFVEHQQAVSYAHSLFRAWTEGWGLSALVLLKWSIAAAMVGAMLGLCIAMARLVFGDHRYRRALVIGFVAMGGLALLLQQMSGQFPPLYGVSVKLLHVLQYPVPLFLIWAASLLPVRQSA
jgi:lipoprotein signal peptidase